MAYGQYQPYMVNPMVGQSNQYYGNYGNNSYQNGYSGMNQPQMNQPPMQNYGQIPQQSYQSPQQMQTSIAFINGQIEARAYPVAPGNRVYLFDTDGRTYYIKGVDFNGMPLPFKIFDSTEVIEPQLPMQNSYADSPNQVNMADYIRRDEVEDMISQEVEKRLLAMNNTKAGTMKRGSDTGA